MFRIFISKPHFNIRKFSIKSFLKHKIFLVKYLILDQIINWEQMYTGLLNLADKLLLTILQCTNTTSVIPKWGAFSPFSSWSTWKQDASWRCHNNVSLYFLETSQVSFKWNTQQRLNGTSPRSLSSTSPRCLIGTSWRRLKRT